MVRWKTIEMEGRNQSNGYFCRKESSREKNNNHKCRIKKISWVIVLKLGKSYLHRILCMRKCCLHFPATPSHLFIGSPCDLLISWFSTCSPPSCLAFCHISLRNWCLALNLKLNNRGYPVPVSFPNLDLDPCFLFLSHSSLSLWPSCYGKTFSFEQQFKWFL